MLAAGSAPAGLLPSLQLQVDGLEAGGSYLMQLFPDGLGAPPDAVEIGVSVAGK